MRPLRKVTGFRALPWRFSPRHVMVRDVELRLECGHTVVRVYWKKPVKRVRCQECWEAQLARDADALERARGDVIGTCAACHAPIYAKGSPCCVDMRLA